MSVVNMKQKARYDVYVGRGRGSTFGNPIVIGKPCLVCDKTHGRAGVVACYEVWLRQRIAWDLKFRRAVAALQGKVLCCWCAPLACHADVLVKVSSELNRKGGK